MKKMTKFCTAVAVLMAGPVFAQSGPNCAPREMVVDRLASKYGETRQSMGLGANNAVVEVFASDTSGSWTIIVTCWSTVQPIADSIR